MDAGGKPVSEPCFINTQDLVVSEDPNDCLGSYALFYFFNLVLFISFH